MLIRTIRESTSTVTKQDIIKMIRLYGFDKTKFEKLIMDNEPSQYFSIETEHGDINVEVEYEIRNIRIEAPDRVLNEISK